MPRCGAGRQHCPGCGEELIHRDHRKRWESASAFGQIVWRDGPRNLTTGDIDHYAVVFDLAGKTLLRLIEHKQPEQTLKARQRQVLIVLGSLIEHCIECPASSVALDERSGLFLLRGRVRAEANGTRRTFFDGPTAVEKVGSGTLQRKRELADGGGYLSVARGDSRHVRTLRPAAPASTSNLRARDRERERSLRLMPSHPPHPPRHSASGGQARHQAQALSLRSG